VFSINKTHQSINQSINQSKHISIAPYVANKSEPFSTFNAHAAAIAEKYRENAITGQHW